MFRNKYKHVIVTPYTVCYIQKIDEDGWLTKQMKWMDINGPQAHLI